MQNIRLATSHDANSISEIYQTYIIETPITFETAVPSIIEMQDRILKTLKLFPWLVWEQDGTILGYAYATPFKSRAAYSWSVESTVYVRKGHHGKGIGKQLYISLLDKLREQGVVNVIAGISLPNPSSVGLHENLGFKQVAQFNEVGFKLDQWWDVGYWQIQIQKIDKPKPLRVLFKRQ